MPGVSSGSPAPFLFVNGLPAEAYARIAAGATAEPARNSAAFIGYRPFAPGAAQGTGRVLVRILNLSTSPQPLAAITLGHNVAGYLSRTLEVGYPADTKESWGGGSGSPADRVPAFAAVEPGLAVDALLDLGSGALGGPSEPSYPGFVTTTGGAGASRPASIGMAGMDIAPGGTVPCAMMAVSPTQAPEGGLASSLAISGTVACGAMQCQMLSGAR